MDPVLFTGDLSILVADTGMAGDTTERAVVPLDTPDETLWQSLSLCSATRGCFR